MAASILIHSSTTQEAANRQNSETNDRGKALSRVEPAAGMVIPSTLGVLSIDIFEATGWLVRDGALGNTETAETTDMNDTTIQDSGIFSTDLTAPIAPTAPIIRTSIRT